MRRSIAIRSRNSQAQLADALASKVQDRVGVCVKSTKSKSKSIWNEQFPTQVHYCFKSREGEWHTYECKEDEVERLAGWRQEDHSAP